MTEYRDTPFRHDETMEEDRFDFPEADKASPAVDQPKSSEEGKPRARKIGLIALAIVVLLGLAIYGLTRFLAPPAQDTDDAYVGGNVVSITARENGTVLALHADDTQAVTRGAALIDLDPAQQQVALAAAEAELGKAVRDVRSGQSAVAEGSAAIAKAASDLQRAEADYARRKSAAAAGAISGEELSHAADAVSSARASLTLAQAQRNQAASSVAGADIANNPQVLAAAANVRKAAIDLSYMTIKSPVAGIVAQRNVQLGQQVSAGSPLMAVVPLDSLWVDANFRETQLADLRVGQPATITFDAYGSAQTFHGKVMGLGAGSGNAFSLLPAQNASGNWIKIVQRVPVRIALDPRELRAHPLRIGLSAKVNVDTSNRSGPLVATATAPAGGVQASLDGGPQVEAEINRIIAANMGGTRR